MKEYLYHGSHESGILSLQPVSPLHGAQDTKVVYLSGSAPYSVFYIWDAQHNLTPRKHVTCTLKDGVVRYEEQFPGQLRAFYQGVSGYLYSIEKTADMLPAQNRENMWTCAREVQIAKTEYIPDVYEHICRLIADGKVIVTQADELFKAQLNAHIAQDILRCGLLSTPDVPDARFYARFFPHAWDIAKSSAQEEHP